jgi:hypothetical protein
MRCADERYFQVRCDNFFSSSDMLCLTRPSMAQLSPSISSVLTLAMLLSSAFADTIILKSGERIEGKILNETDKELTLEIKISAGITDERVVAKTDIDKISKVSPEMEAYKAISTIQTGANSLAVSQYEPLLRALQGFLLQYPNSPNAAVVQAAFDDLQAEMKRVEKGEAKLDGQWLSKAEVEKEKIQIGGRIAFNYMKQQAAAGDFIGALNTFSALEKPYGGAATFPDSIDLARQIIARFKATVEAAIPNQKVIKAEREKGFAAAGPLDRKEMMEAYKKEQDAAEAAVAAAEKASKWPPFIAGSEKSLLALQARVTRESERLALLPVDKMRRSLQLVDEGKMKITDGELDEAVTTLKEATTLWSANDLAVRLAKDAETQKADAAKAAAEAAKATPTPKPSTPKSTTPRPSAAIQAATAPAATEEEDKPFYLTLPGAIGIVVGIAGVLIGVNVFMKMKKKKEAEAA